MRETSASWELAEVPMPSTNCGEICAEKGFGSVPPQSPVTGFGLVIRRGRVSGRQGASGSP